MNTKLSIIIPYDDATNQLLHSSLTFLDNQLKVDWSKGEIQVILVQQDENNKIDTNIYPNVGKYIVNLFIKGTKATQKQVALNATKGQYITFLPIGTMFSSSVAIYNILDTINRNKVDLLMFHVVDGNHRTDKNNEQYRDQKSDLIGKVISKDFIRRNDIAFYGGLTCYEDNAFARLLLNANPQYFYSTSPCFLYATSKKADPLEYVDNCIDAELAVSVSGLKSYTYKLQRDLISLCYAVYYSFNTEKIEEEEKQKLLAKLKKIAMIESVIALPELKRLDFTALNIKCENFEGRPTFVEFMQGLLEETTNE